MSAQAGGKTALRALLAEAAQRLQGWSAGAGPDGKLITRIEAALKAPRSAEADAAGAVQRALALLNAASSDWRARGPSDGSAPLHWPIAVAAARAQLTHALAQRQAERGGLLATLRALREDHMRMEPHHAHLCPLCRQVDAVLADADVPCPDGDSTDEGHGTRCGGYRLEPGPNRVTIAPDAF